jgi:hypothetical protein
LERNRSLFFVLAVLIALTLAASARGALAFSVRAFGAEAGGGIRLLRGPSGHDRGRQYIGAARVHEQRKPPLADEASRESEDWESENSGKVSFDRRGAPASEERTLCLSKVFVTERFLREKSLESAAVKPEHAAAAKVPAGVFLKSEAESPVILLRTTPIAVRK